MTAASVPGPKVPSTPFGSKPSCLRVDCRVSTSGPDEPLFSTGMSCSFHNVCSNEVCVPIVNVLIAKNISHVIQLAVLTWIQSEVERNQLTIATPAVIQSLSNESRFQGGLSLEPENGRYIFVI